MKVKVEKFPIRHNGKKYLLGEIFKIEKKDAESLLDKEYVSIVEDDEETIEEEKVEITEEEVIKAEEKTEITEEEIENSEVPKKKKTNKNK